MPATGMMHWGRSSAAAIHQLAVAAAGSSGHTDPARVYFRASFEVIGRRDGVPAFDSRRRVAERLPPPHAQADVP